MSVTEIFKLVSIKQLYKAILLALVKQFLVYLLNYLHMYYYERDHNKQCSITNIKNYEGIYR